MRISKPFQNQPFGSLSCFRTFSPNSLNKDSKSSVLGRNHTQNSDFSTAITPACGKKNQKNKRRICRRKTIRKNGINTGNFIGKQLIFQCLSPIRTI